MVARHRQSWVQRVGNLVVWYRVLRGSVQNGTTAMYIAAQKGYKECIEVLAGLGAALDKADTVSMEGAAQSAVGAHGGADTSWVSWY